MINVQNNICTALNNLYGNLLSFLDRYNFNEEQEKYIKNIKLNLEISLPMGKYTTSILEQFKIKEDPTYNQKKFFEEEKIEKYIEEMTDDLERLKSDYKNYKIKNINEKTFFNELDGYKKYELIKNYEETYKLAMLLNDTLDEEQKKKFDQVIKRIIHCYYMAYRMCRKLEEYRKKHPFDGDNGKFWKKDQKMSMIKHHALRFRKINEERFERKK